MTKYIDKDALVAEIESLWKHYLDAQEFDFGWNQALDKVLSYLDTLEVKEVDLERELSYAEYQDFFNKHPNLPNVWGFDETWICAKYFYSLGLKAQKGE